MPVRLQEIIVMRVSKVSSAQKIGTTFLCVQRTESMNSAPPSPGSPGSLVTAEDPDNANPSYYRYTSTLRD